MKYALISDIHANLPALEAVLVQTGVLSHAEIEHRTAEFRTGAREA